MVQDVNPMGSGRRAGNGKRTVADRFFSCLDRYAPFLRRWIRRRRHLRNFFHHVYQGRGRLPVSENDYYRLSKVLREARKRNSVKPARLVKFRQLLRRTEILPVRRVPRDVITMNSQFTVLTKRQRVIRLQLVYPEEANRAAGRISILSWLGMCLLGKRTGDRIVNDLSVQTVLYQPEYSDDFHL